MKTKALLLTFSLLIALSVKAQFKKYTFGLKAAPQISWMKPNVNNYESNGVKIGFSWGLVSEFNFSENYCIGTGFNIVFNGGKLKFPTPQNINTPKSRVYSVKSVEIPLTLKMRTNEIGKMKYYGQIGLGTSFRFAAKKTDELMDGTSTAKTNYDNISFLRESLIVGLGAEYKLQAGTILSAGLALNNGFTDILTGKTGISEKENATINFVELNVVVLF